jgi:hypothetical protein
MADLYFGEDGDLKISVNGDVAITPSESRNLAQQVYLRVMTEFGDFPIYPDLGAQLDRMFGMPQTPRTGAFGEKIITEALNRDGLLRGKTLSVEAIPTGPQTIKFNIYTVVQNRNSLILSIEQDLGVE